MNIRDGYVLLGLILISIGIVMPLCLGAYALIPSIVTYVKSSSQPSPSSTACTVVTMTVTAENGDLHRLFNVTCSEAMHVSSLIFSMSNATLPAEVQSLLSNVSYTISVVSTIATVAVAFAIMPFQGEDYDGDSCASTWHRLPVISPLVAIICLSTAVVLALFLTVAQPLNAISAATALCVILSMLGCTLVGYGFGIVSWGSLKKAVDHSENTVPIVSLRKRKRTVRR